MKLNWEQIQSARESLAGKPYEFAAFITKAFSYEENILLYAKFFFPHYAVVDSPEFHDQLIRLLHSGGNGGIAAPRGHAKTTMANIVYLSWLCVYRKQHFVMVGSETYSLAVMNVNAIKFELENNDLLIAVYGEQKTEKWQDGEFITTGDTMVMAISYGGKMRGIKHKQYRPDLILLDDMENDKNVRSADQRHFMRDWLTKAVLPALAKGGRVKVIGTVLHSDSLLYNIVNGNDEFASWKRNSQLFKALNEEGDNEYSLWPAMYTVEELKMMRDDPDYAHYKGSLAFSQEMQNEPLADEDRVFKQEWVDGPEETPYRYSMQEKMAEWENEHPNEDKEKSWATEEMVQILGAVDPAISEKQRADFWVFFTVGIDRKGHIWMLDVIRTKTGDVDAQAQMVIDGYKNWKHDKIWIESVAYQAGLYNIIKKRGAEQNVYPPVHPMVQDRDKVRRATIHSASFSGGLVHLRTDHELSNVVREEFLQFPRGSHDDVVDAFMTALHSTVKKSRGRTFTKKPKGF